MPPLWGHQPPMMPPMMWGATYHCKQTSNIDTYPSTSSGVSDTRCDTTHPQHTPTPTHPQHTTLHLPPPPHPPPTHCPPTYQPTPHHHPPTHPQIPPTTHPWRKSGALMPDISWAPPHSLPIWLTINDVYNQWVQRLMSMQYLEAINRPTINSFTGEHAKVVNNFWQGNRVEEGHAQNNNVKKLPWLFFLC